MDVIIVILTITAASGAFVNDLKYAENYVNHREFLLRKKYMPHYHITAPEGWINNPSGFTIFKRQYHLFYQYHPYNGAWGHMSWGHAVSDDLVDWTYYPAALIPKDYYDLHGCLSGTALVRKRYLTLFYTGTIVEDSESLQTQNIALSTDGIIFQKYLYNPIIRRSPNRFEENRNPKVWRHRKLWYMLVGATNILGCGQLNLFTSKDMFNWELNGTVIESYGDMGQVWESPDLFQIGEHHVLMLSVQGVKSDGFRYRNLYQTGYIVGKFNYQRGKFEDAEISTATFNEVDYGHDFYGAKTTKASDGRILMVAWLGMWESDFTESTTGWVSMLTLIREVRINKFGRLLINPVREIAELRVEMIENAWYNPGEKFPAEAKAFELVVNSTSAFSDVGIIFEWEKGHFVIAFSANHGYVSVDRGGVDGIRRAYWSPDKFFFLRIFIDASSIEIFCGDGEVVFSSRIYPKAINIRIAGQTPLHIEQYRLRRSVGFDSKLVKRLMDTVLNGS
ncbi:sucrose-6-phosphate hydrolase-like [Leptidea sinapis]|uniref:sucrose-6-phosphate hydrolase-like n=1 Tax=Leptidea sinapis TaxID=189913 RepID=UPI0021C44F10|nr:sucrose-6-phosphate hydrolase-like [Leptidea sinapis]